MLNYQMFNIKTFLHENWIFFLEKKKESGVPFFQREAKMSKIINAH